MVTGVSGPTMTAQAITTSSHNATTPTTHPIKENSNKNDRRSNKPIMEKRRRARINNCLNELKTLILDATKKDPARHSKLEKADILEKTVKHLQDLQRQQNTMQQAADPKLINKFKAGFVDCINEVNRFPNLDPIVKRRLIQHLHNCINGVRPDMTNNSQYQCNVMSTSSTARTTITTTPTAIGTTGTTLPSKKFMSQHLSQLQSLPSPPSSPEQDQSFNNIQLPILTTLQQQQQQQQQIYLQQQQQQHQQQQQQQQQYLMNTQIQQTPHGYILSNGLQVIPTKLSNGNVALVLPENVPVNHHQHQALPLTKSIVKTFNYVNSLPTTLRNDAAQTVCRNMTMPTSYTLPSPMNTYDMTMDYKVSSSSSSSTSTSSSSSINSSSNMMQPLSLVIRKQNQQDQLEQQPLKQYIKVEEQPWRPW